MGPKIVVIGRMRLDVDVQRVRSNVTVTSLVMVVQGGGVDALDNRMYAMGKTHVVIGRMKSIV